MAQPYIGEIRIFAGNFAPAGWMFCEGQNLPISENETLFQLIGTTYGGDGESTFALPDLRGRVPLHAQGNVHTLGQRAGAEAHTLSTAELPQHTHVMNGSATNADVVLPTDNVVAQSSQLYGPAVQLTTLDPSSNGSTGGSQAHLNMQTYVTLSFCIALQGIFPSHS